MTRSTLVIIALGICGCPAEVKEDDTSVVGIDDTADINDTDDTDTHGTCEAAVIGMTPLDGATAVYYRDPLEVSFDEDGSFAVLTLADAGGNDVPFTTTWTEGNVQAILDVVLVGDTTYTLTADVCGVVTTAAFTTSSLGAPLSVATSDLIGRTFMFRLSESTITEPAFLDFVASTYLIVPLLISVSEADDTTIELLGGVGEQENDGTFTQVMEEETWDFPAGAFSEQPYFEAYAEYITVSYSGIPIPIEGFGLSGTFTADGSQIQKGIASGLGDSRHMWPLLGLEEEDYNAVCEIAAGAGVKCLPCSDGEPYCLDIVAEEVTAVWEEGLVMEEVILP